MVSIPGDVTVVGPLNLLSIPGEVTAVGPLNLVSIPGEIKDHTLGLMCNVD